MFFRTYPTLRSFSSSVESYARQTITFHSLERKLKKIDFFSANLISPTTTEASVSATIRTVWADPTFSRRRSSTVRVKRRPTTTNRKTKSRRSKCPRPSVRRRTSSAQRTNEIRRNGRSSSTTRASRTRRRRCWNRPTSSNRRPNFFFTTKTAEKNCSEPEASMHSLFSPLKVTKMIFSIR